MMLTTSPCVTSRLMSLRTIVSPKLFSTFLRERISLDMGAISSPLVMVVREFLLGLVQYELDDEREEPVDDRGDDIGNHAHEGRGKRLGFGKHLGDAEHEGQGEVSLTNVMISLPMAGKIRLMTWGNTM